MNSYQVTANLLVNICLNLVLILRYGIEGAAWATTISYTVQLAGAVAIYRRLSGSGPLTVLQRSGLELWRSLGPALVRRAIVTGRLRETAQIR